MALFLYNIFCGLYLLAIKMFSLFNGKAKKWITGRKNWEQNLKIGRRPNEKYIWVHCSSLGEFEQGRPLMENLKKEYPAYKIILTFFSPSGYEIQKNYNFADHVLYLPMDSARNAKNFVATTEPSLAVFVKYEFWYHYLDQLQRRQIPVILISATFRESQPFFKWYGGLFRKMLQCFNTIFIQEEASGKLLAGIGINRDVIVSGDTRHDRVGEIRKNLKPIGVVEEFKDGNRLLIAGSTWQDDEKILHDSFSILPPGWKLIIAPHEIHAAHINEMMGLFGDDAILFSETTGPTNIRVKKVLIIDNIGMLSSLYSYGTIALVGGGFEKGGIHNILEPAVFGLPILFGPTYKKFVEANKLVALNYAFPVNNTGEFAQQLQKLITDDSYLNSIHTGLKKFMQENTGATGIIMENIKNKGWLK